MQNHHHKIPTGRPFAPRVRFADASLPTTTSFAASSLRRLTREEHAMRLCLPLDQGG